MSLDKFLLVSGISLTFERRPNSYKVCSANDKACVRGFPLVPLVGIIVTICTNLIITYVTICKEFGANLKNFNTICASSPNVSNQWYHWENLEYTHSHLLSTPPHVQKNTIDGS